LQKQELKEKEEKQVQMHFVVCGSANETAFVDEQIGGASGQQQDQ
jgi:hypothetical protein